MAKGEKFKGSDAQRSRRAGARGPGPGAIGRGKIRAAKFIEENFPDAGEYEPFMLRSEGSRLLGQDYGRKIGNVGEVGFYEMGGEVGGSCRGGGAALRGTKFRGVR